MSAPSMAIRAVHLIPQRFLREPVFTGQKWPQLLVDHDRDFFIDRSVQSLDATIGDDLQIERGDGRFRRGGSRRVAIRLLPQFLINIERVDLMLLVDPAHGVAVSAELPYFDRRDFQYRGLSQGGRYGQGQKVAS
jgi:hypothetical protein